MNKIEEAIKAIDQEDSVRELREVLARARKHLKSIPQDVEPVACARALVDIAELLLGLGQGEEAWTHAREAFSVFVNYEEWQDAVEAADILYQCGSPILLRCLGRVSGLRLPIPSVRKVRSPC